MADTESKELTVTELKAMIYDRLALIERCQLEIRQLNQQLAQALPKEVEKTQ